MNPYNKALISAIRKDEKEHQVKDFNLSYVHIKHEDKSEFRITHAKVERVKVKVGKRELDSILVYSEHNGIFLFIELDLESVIVKPWKGRKQKIKINKKW